MPKAKGNSKRRPRLKNQPHPTKQPKTQEPAGYDHLEISWAFDRADRAKSWRCSLHHVDAWELLDHLSEKEHESWASLKQAGSHNIAVEKLIKDAQKRLSDLKSDDLDELFSLRLTGKIRIWGIRDRYRLRVMWFDRDHEICPSPKK